MRRREIVLLAYLMFYAGMVIGVAAAYLVGPAVVAVAAGVCLAIRVIQLHRYIRDTTLDEIKP